MQEDDFDINDYPSSVPNSFSINLQGFNYTQEIFDLFTSRLQKIIILCGRFMNLELLNGITVGVDYDAALDSVDLGYESTIAKTYTKTADLVGVAKTLKVIRNNQIKAHVVYRAANIENIINNEPEKYFFAANLVAHELGHVAEFSWRMKAMPELILKPYPFDCFITSRLYDAAIVIWEEYAACRLASLFHDDENNLLVDYGETFNQCIENTLEKIYQQIKEYRLHADIEKLFLETGMTILEPLKVAGYLLGHLDGTSKEIEVSKLCPNYTNSIYKDILPKMQDELKILWDTKDSWSGIQIFDKLHLILIEQFSIVGIHMTKTPDGYYLDVPFTPQTLP